MRLTFELLLMTSRSGSSMVADIYRLHGFHWAKNSQNPLVGRKVRYRSFENQIVKNFNKAQFGMPLGDMITFDDTHAAQFLKVLENEYTTERENMWKGAVEFYPIWKWLADAGCIDMHASIVYRDQAKVVESVMAKRNGRADIDEANRITQKRYDIMHDLASDYALPLIMTDELIAGNFSSIKAAFEDGGYTFLPEIATQVIDPNKWETDR